MMKLCPQVEREEAKLEKEKLRLEKERLRTLEREAKLEKLKGRLSQAEVETAAIRNTATGPIPGTVNCWSSGASFTKQVNK